MQNRISDYTLKKGALLQCFIRFIVGKQRRHMGHDKYKVKFGETAHRDKVVLPMSFGSSSLALLDILLTQFAEQSKNPRVKIGFELDVVFVDDSDIIEYKNSAAELIHLIQTAYDTDRFPIRFTILNINDYIKKDTSPVFLTLSKEFFSTVSLLNNPEPLTVVRMLRTSPNRASRHDLQQIIVSQIIKDHVKSTGATSILWGHNMSTLAEQVLSLTVKGRGSEIHLHLSDGTEEIGGAKVDVIHPLRDASRNEIDKFVTLRGLERFKLIPAVDIQRLMNKQKTINEVVANYYSDVDTGDDNIVSTVVRTGAKLAVPKTFEDKKCAVCRGKIYNKPMNWLRDITYNGHRGPENELEEELLAEWANFKKEKKTKVQMHKHKDVDLCYGCAVTVGGHAESTIEWPIVVEDEEEAKQRVLDEFVISDDDE